MKLSEQKTLELLRVNGGCKMRLSDYTTLKAISESSGVKYHKLYRTMNEVPGVKRTKVGTVIFIKKSSVKKILRWCNAH